MEDVTPKQDSMFQKEGYSVRANFFFVLLTWLYGVHPTSYPIPVIHSWLVRNDQWMGSTQTWATHPLPSHPVLLIQWVHLFSLSPSIDYLGSVFAALFGFSVIRTNLIHACGGAHLLKGLKFWPYCLHPMYNEAHIIPVLIVSYPLYQSLCLSSVTNIMAIWPPHFAQCLTSAVLAHETVILVCQTRVMCGHSTFQSMSLLSILYLFWFQLHIEHGASQTTIEKRKKRIHFFFY